MSVKPEEHHHTCRKSEDHHCPGCCSCECCGGFRKYHRGGRKYYQGIFRVGDKVIVDINDNYKSGVIISSRPKNRQEEVRVRITGYEDEQGFPSDWKGWLPIASVFNYEDFI